MSATGNNLSFEPSGAVTFDLKRGRVNQGARCETLLVPAAALRELCAAVDARTRVRFVDAIGGALGRRVRERLAAAVPADSEAQGTILDVPFELVVEHLAGELALIGWGVLKVERWGRALILVVKGSPLAVKHAAGDARSQAKNPGDGVMAALLGAALSEASGDAVALVELPREAGGATNMLAVHADAAAGIRARLDAGEPWAAMLAKLNARLDEAESADADGEDEDEVSW
ncbi:MAG: hypothetical protein EXR75_09140 [Myxococcales bacterium]|nr:hypothetical protein [Myxococcales bacterium]